LKKKKPKRKNLLKLKIPSAMRCSTGVPKKKKRCRKDPKHGKGGPNKKLKRSFLGRWEGENPMGRVAQQKKKVFTNKGEAQEAGRERLAAPLRGKGGKDRQEKGEKFGGEKMI